MALELFTFIEKIIEVLNEKKTELAFHDIYPFDPLNILELPLIAVVFRSAIPTRLNEEQLRYELTADIFYYFARADADYQIEILLDRLAFMAVWLMKNQTLKGFSLSNWVNDVGSVEVPKGNYVVISGKVTLTAWKDGINIKAVEQP